jgi:CheY-like chemotaxis protein
LLERILRNLLHNAARYTQSGAVMVICKRRKDGIAIEVRDSGPGIPVNKQSLIFEEFSQLDNAERNREKGLGLGLAIVARLAALLNYRVNVSSRPGAGSIFSVCVPVAHAIPIPIPVEDEVDPAQSALKGMRVLVVDDDRDIMNAMTLLLNRWGCRYQMLSRVEAQTLAEQVVGAPDVIIADYRLPGTVSGIDLIRKLRMLFGTIPAVVITGDTEPSILREAQANECILMHKPLDAATLYNLLVNLGKC